VFYLSTKFQNSNQVLFRLKPESTVSWNWRMKNVQELLHIEYTVTRPLISKLINVVNKYIDIGTYIYRMQIPGHNDILIATETVQLRGPTDLYKLVEWNIHEGILPPFLFSSDNHRSLIDTFAAECKTVPSDWNTRATSLLKPLKVFHVSAKTSNLTYIIIIRHRQH